MKTKVIELGAICAAVALLLVLSSPAYAKSGGSSGAQTRVSKTPSNTNSMKPVRSSRTTQSGPSKKSEKANLEKKVGITKTDSTISGINKSKQDAARVKGQLVPVELQIKDTMQKLDNKKQQEQTVKDNIQGQQDKSGSIQKNLDATADQQREMNKTINCLANC
jgi:hypothetical protein